MLLDQLSGYRKIAKALREQKHEFKNKLHVIVGLLKMKDYEAVNTYVNQSVYQTNLTSDYYSSRLEDDQISALFVGKDILAKEYETNLKLSSDSYLSLSHNPVSSDDLIIVVGNLIDNAFEAFKEEHKNREVTVKIIEDDQQISIGVLDNAGTLENYMKEEMFQRGVSTKKGENRGTGLYLVNEIIRMYGGEKNVQVSKRKTYIEIILKKVKQ
jgi:sensor histidine kinase regulating citrate/malate metabolism